MTNLHQLTSHITTSCPTTYGDRIVTVDYCDFTSTYLCDANASRVTIGTQANSADHPFVGMLCTVSNAPPTVGE